jgi:diguanylate cyclase (GGDEF)-like protein
MASAETASHTNGSRQGGGSALDESPTQTRRRLETLAALGILDRIGDPVLTALTRLAQEVTGASSAAVHIFDDTYQRRVAAAGVPLVDHPAEDSMCRLVVEGETRIVTADATRDEQFAYSSFVTDPVAPLRFFASVPLMLGGGVAVGALCAFDTESRKLNEDQVNRLEDIAAVARAHLELIRVASELGEAATTDSLTGAVNRVLFDDRLAQAFARRKRHGSPLVVALIDLDRFKSINDTYGHQRGDEALQWVANRLLGRFRGEDTVARLGGDEFALLAEISEPSQTALQALKAELELTPDGFVPPFTVSVGVVLATDEDDAESIVRRADAAMYAAKKPKRR